MNITYAKWADAAQTTITTTIDGIEMSVPNAMGNMHRRALAKWEAEGGIIDAYVTRPKYPDAAAAKAAMIQWVTDFTTMVTGPVSVDERLSWDAK